MASNPFRTVPDSELVIEFVRSSGPGGQNVNKTSTKAQLRWNVGDSAAFSGEEKDAIRRRLANRINKRDEVVIASDRERSQLQNKNAAVAQLQSLVAHALTPTAKRVATAPTRSSKTRRLVEKTEHSRKKAARRKTGLGLLVLAALVFFGAGCWSRVSEPQPLAKDSGWKTYTNAALGFTFKYPPYASSTDDVPNFPEDVIVLNLGSVVTNTNAESVPETALHVKRIPIDRQDCQRTVDVDGRMFCLNAETDAGAGNLYNVYSYATTLNDSTIVFSFVVHSLQCGNFTRPEEQCVPFAEDRDTAGFEAIVRTFRSI